MSWMAVTTAPIRMALDVSWHMDCKSSCLFNYFPTFSPFVTSIQRTFSIMRLKNYHWNSYCCKTWTTCLATVRQHIQRSRNEGPSADSRPMRNSIWGELDWGGHLVSCQWTERESNPMLLVFPTRVSICLFLPSQWRVIWMPYQWSLSVHKYECPSLFPVFVAHIESPSYDQNDIE